MKSLHGHLISAGMPASAPAEPSRRAEAYHSKRTLPELVYIICDAIICPGSAPRPVCTQESYKSDFGS